MKNKFQKWSEKISDPTKPPLTLLMKLGSALIHAEEGFGVDRSPCDIVAFQQLMNDDEVKAWVKAMGVYLPVKR